MNNAKTISLDELGEEVADIIEKYGVAVASNLADVVGEVAEDFKSDIPQEMSTTGIGRTPNHRHHLADSWRATPIVDTATEKVVRVHAINGKYRIVHLLENDHLTKSGGTFQGRHFLQHLIDKYSPIMETKVKNTIAKGEGL